MGAENHIVCGFLIQNKKKSTTIRSYISAIRTILKEDKICLNEDSFQLNALMRACKFTVERITTHLPIHKDILKVIIKHVRLHFRDQPYLSLLCQTIFVTAYFGLFQIGELTTGDHTVKAVDVQIGQNKRKLMFILRSSKTHGKYNKPQIVKIEKDNDTAKNSQPEKGKIDPFTLLRKYIKARRSCISHSEPFFHIQGQITCTTNARQRCTSPNVEECTF